MHSFVIVGLTSFSCITTERNHIMPPEPSADHYGFDIRSIFFEKQDPGHFAVVAGMAFVEARVDLVNAHCHLASVSRETQCAEPASVLPNVRGESDEDRDGHFSRLCDETPCGDDRVGRTVHQHLRRYTRVHCRVEASRDDLASARSRQKSPRIPAKQRRDVTARPYLSEQYVLLRP